MTLAFPKVSIITPTRDRAPFLALLLRCIQAQDYPASLLEWVVVDDSLEEDSPCLAYPGLKRVRLDPSQGPRPLGLKRNLGHRAATGDILVCMDDDDYQPPHRISRAVQALLRSPGILIAGSSEYPMAYPEGVWMLGPYARYHATAGTFAFRKSLLDSTAYADEARSAEERAFLKGYTIPLLQIPAKDTILAMAHATNTYDKRQILANPVAYKARPLSQGLEAYIRDPDLRRAYRELLGPATS
jgi:glycosyltransferase involved in cell wall biosynthesis